MSQPTRILLSLLAGLIGGVLIARASVSAADVAVRIAQPVGTAWLNGLQMTVIPLVVSLLVTGIAATAEAASAGKLAARTIGFALVLLALNAAAAAVATPLILELVPIPVEAARALRAALVGVPPVQPSPPLAELLAAVVPTNVFAAATNGALLSLIVFTLVFATRRGGGSWWGCSPRSATRCWWWSAGCCGWRRWACSRWRCWWARGREARRSGRWSITWR